LMGANIEEEEEEEEGEEKRDKRGWQEVRL
jgi:hypothetical protein